MAGVGLSGLSGWCVCVWGGWCRSVWFVWFVCLVLSCLCMSVDGDGGFGYDKIFYPENYDISMASIDAEVKNTISHRAIASKLFIKEFESI